MMQLPDVEDYKQRITKVPKNSYILIQAKRNILYGLNEIGNEDKACKEKLLTLYSIVNEYHDEDLKDITRH